MLSAEHRLRSSREFSQVVRKGRRAGRPTLVAHLLLRAPDASAPQDPTRGPRDEAPRAGLVVSKAVGGSVVRHRVSRRLRHLLRARVASLPAGALLVVRATPAAATARSEVLGSDLDAALARLSPVGAR